MRGKGLEENNTASHTLVAARIDKADRAQS
jgi:hypothetical protein